MSQSAALHAAHPAVSQAPHGGGLQVGRTFLHPAFDYLMIGGGLSLLLACVAWATLRGSPLDAAIYFPAVVLFTNNAHFAASTLRLYTKPGAFSMAPFLTMVFPAITILALILGIVFADLLGIQLYKLMLCWSPFHYSAQSYGLAVMYFYRSGLQLTARQKRLLWFCCMITFFKTLLTQHQQGGGIWWIVPYEPVAGSPILKGMLGGAIGTLNVLAFALPAGLFLWLALKERMRIPAICVLVVLANAAWFVFFPLIGAIGATTIFHGIQYMAIVTIFHVKDRMLQTGNKSGPGYHAGFFCLACVAFAYGVFSCWPEAFSFSGLGYFESVFVVIAIVNIHHFIVDAYIWKLRGDTNSRIVTAA